MDTEKNKVVVIGDASEIAGSVAGSAVTIDEADDENPLPKGCVLNDDGTVTVPLREPVTLIWKKAGQSQENHDVHTELVMRRLKGKDMTLINRVPKEKIAMTAIACAVGIPMARFELIFDRMDGADIQTAGGVVSYFLNSGQATGQ